jgi:hypothetical protein
MSFPLRLGTVALKAWELPDGTSVETAKVSPTFPLWLGSAPKGTYGGKPIIDLNGAPTFPELAILRVFEAAGWEGVWIDTFGKRYLRQYWPKPDRVRLPDDKQELLSSICIHGGRAARPWDVFCWSKDTVIFAESKWLKHDTVRLSQRAFLAGALKFGLPKSSFLLVEWSFS